MICPHEPQEFRCGLGTQVATVGPVAPGRWSSLLLVLRGSCRCVSERIDPVDLVRTVRRAAPCASSWFESAGGRPRRFGHRCGGSRHADECAQPFFVSLTTDSTTSSPSSGCYRGLFAPGASNGEDAGGLGVRGSGSVVLLCFATAAHWRTSDDVTVPLIGLMLGGVVGAGTTFVACATTYVSLADGRRPVLRWPA